MDEAAAAGKDVSIHVEKFNPAMRLYRRLGFATEEDKGVYDLMRWTPRRPDRRRAARLSRGTPYLVKAATTYPAQWTSHSCIGVDLRDVLSEPLG